MYHGWTFAEKFAKRCPARPAADSQIAGSRSTSASPTQAFATLTKFAPRPGPVALSTVLSHEPHHGRLDLNASELVNASRRTSGLAGGTRGEVLLADAPSAPTVTARMPCAAAGVATRTARHVTRRTSATLRA